MKLSKKVGLISLSLVLSFATSAFAQHQQYILPKSSFSNYIWVNGGKYFTNISAACVEVQNDAALYIQYWDKNDNFVSSPLLTGSGWQCDPSDAGSSGTYKIRLVNANRTSSVKLIGGEIIYEK
ncbi:hypothetical protein [Paenibacillus ehimensis]|uniref:Uncharacterized protein n=1 Tax=Paenibacillus ehimensis TaxID=79264 RepID=A0ABT8VE28_9BACL|nr:hypothetical protein [Paenibacillus ehimensis]MDO3679237.1 hypothetical protein [Paenibacillus ehimensis]MEC0207861.1 hypothetical protein [Paenibacillus ehimensis]